MESHCNYIIFLAAIVTKKQQQQQQQKFKGEFLCGINIGLRLLYCWFHFYLQLKLPQIYSSIILESWKPKLTCINL